MADGRLQKMEIVGPVETRSTSCRVVVLPGTCEILLGSIPREDMDVLIDPRQEKLIVNPETPYLAKKKIK